MLNRGNTAAHRDLSAVHEWMVSPGEKKGCASSHAPFNMISLADRCNLYRSPPLHKLFNLCLLPQLGNVLSDLLGHLLLLQVILYLLFGLLKRNFPSFLLIGHFD
jgi:hypothetical protein